MTVLNKILEVLKSAFWKTLGFFTGKNKATKNRLEKFDYVDILIALLPATVFGCLLFGINAVAVLAVSVILSAGLDFLWDLIFKKQKNAINLSAVVYGLLLGLSLSSSLNLFLVAAVNIITVFLRKTVFKQKPLQVTAPLLLTRAVLGLVFFKAFTVYTFPFVSNVNTVIPLNSLYDAFTYESLVFSAKYLFFGLHSGNIGETSVLLISVGGIYLMFRKLINPIIPASFIATSCLLSLIFGENLALSLMGGGLFLAAMFMTLDYSFKTSPRYKKLLYGVACGLLTFILRKLFKTESVLLAVLITDFVFFYVTRRNIKRTINFIKKPDFKKLLNKAKRVFSV